MGATLTKRVASREVGSGPCKSEKARLMAR